jgi:Domain of unknown function (DUF4389)
VEPHPIRVVVTDDLARNRLTVFFRLVLAIPHFIWFILWSIAAVVAAIVNWFATLFRGTSPRGLHNFLAAYVRYSTHLYAYLYLAANPYPPFDGTPGYPVDVEIDEPAPQNRWKVAFRIVLALPALVLAAALSGNGWGGGGGGQEADDTSAWATTSLSVAVTVAFLAWFAILARGRMPRGFRDFLAYALRYGAQTSGYLLLLTDRYPNSNTEDPRPVEAPPRHPVTLTVTDDLGRSRLTTFFRLLLAIPHFVWLALWGVVVLITLLGAWFIVLFTGRLPQALHRFFTAFLRYQAHVFAFLFLVTNPFPGFTGAPGYPLHLDFDPPERQNRWITGFRLFLAIPALLVSSALTGPLILVGIFGWAVALALGRMPEGLRNLGAYAIRYTAQVDAYLYLVTDRYPDSGPVQRRPEHDEAEPEPAAA